MLSLLKSLCQLNGPSGEEKNVRDFIISEIKGCCDYKTDNLGNLICFKKGEKTPKNRLMLDAHMDEVGIIITSVTSDGFLKFNTVGGIDTTALMFKRVKIGKTVGIISSKPIHLLSKDEGKKAPAVDSLYIDIAAADKDDALKSVSLGDEGVILSDFTLMNGCVKSKALDDRIGCAILITLLKERAEYDFYAVFSTQEEIGLRGARVATFAVNPDYALVIEATTAADIAGVSEDKTVCNLGCGPAVSFMDRTTLYDKELFNAALQSGIKCQAKRMVSGGNNAGSIHLSREGVKALTISLPCRYIHSDSSIANISDMEDMLKLTKYMMNKILKDD